MTINHSLRKRLVLTADDYGIRHTAEPILALARAGKLDRVAVMTNYVTQEAASALVKTGVKLDIHFEAISLMGRGEAIESGVWHRGKAFLRALFSGRLARQSVEAEWRSQIERFRTLFGRLPDGLNSHEHIHFFPWFFGIVDGLANEYQVKTIRFATRGILWRESHSLIGFILAVCRLFGRNRAKRSQLKSSNWLIGLDWLTHYEMLFSSLPPTGTVEIVVHPEREEEQIFLEQYF